MKEDQVQLGKPPIGITPYYLWLEHVDHEPDFSQLYHRYQEVSAACVRYREAGLAPREEWLKELGVQ